MLEIRERSEGAAEAELVELTLTLPFEDRQRSRLRVQLSSGEEALLRLPRGSVLRGGDLLALSDGRSVRVRAASEQVSTVSTDEARSLARAAYHLGNRHVPLEVGQGFVRYLHDHVLDAMVQGLGLTVCVEEAPFEPEAGAYGRAGHSHSHEGVHSHLHEGAHSHSHEGAHAHSHEGALSHGDAHSHKGAHSHSHEHVHEAGEPTLAGDRRRRP